MNPPIQTRLATLDDIPALTDLLVSYQAFYDYTPDREGARAFLQDGLASGQAIIFMCTRGDDALGYLQKSRPAFTPPNCAAPTPSATSTCPPKPEAWG